MLFYQSEEQNREKMANTAPLGKNTLGDASRRAPDPLQRAQGPWWWESARFHLCLPKDIGTMCGKAVSPRRAHGPDGVQAGRLCVLRLVLAKWRYLVLPILRDG
jgi:hypothetical protein